MKNTRATSFRWQPGLFVLALATAAWWLVSMPEELERQTRVMMRAGILILTLVSLLAWIMAFSRLSIRRRLVIGAATVVVAACLPLVVRLRGFTGDVRPIFELRKPSTSSDGAAPGLAELAPRTGWPQFLGPRRNGQVAGVALARDWATLPPRIVWRRPVGRGWSGFAVDETRAFTQELRDGKEAVVAMRLRDGEILWRHEYGGEFVSALGGDGPRGTPALLGMRVFVVGAEGDLLALDSDSGHVLWQTNFGEQFSSPIPIYGHSGSPLVFGDAVIVAPGGSGSLIAAFAISDGHLLWKGGSDSAGYSSPALLEVDGVSQVVTLNGSSVTGVSALDGRLLWSHPWTSSNPHIAQPIGLGGGDLVVSSGYGVGAERIHVSSAGSGWQVTSIWKSPRLKAKFTNPVVADGWIYGLDDGVLVCLDPATGERRWKGGRYGHGQTILVGDLLIVQSEDGEVVLVEANPERLVELGRIEVLAGKAWNSPALADPYLLVRNDREAVLLELPIATSSRSSLSS